MKRPFPRFEVLGIAAALVAGAACTPNNSVKPGAPVLMEMTVVESGAAGQTFTTVTAMTTSCPTNTKDQGACVSASFPACETADTNILCRCVPNPPPPMTTTDAGTSDAGPADAGMSGGGTSDAAMSDAATSDAARPDGGKASADASSDAAPPPAPDGTWSCTFAPTSSVLYVFDRLLDTTPFDPNMGVSTAATLSETPANGRVSSSATYASNGLQNQTIFGFLGYPDGPNVTIAGSPALPTSSTVAIMLDKTAVRAKDGTPFTATGLLIDGAVKFVTQKFLVTAFNQPPAPMVDAGADAAAPPDLPDMTPATISFTNIVNLDPTKPDTLVGRITASATPLAGGTPMNVAVDLATTDGLNVTITPTAKPTPTSWPPSSSITISVDTMTTDAVGDLLAAPVAPITFPTSSK